MKSDHTWSVTGSHSLPLSFRLSLSVCAVILFPQKKMLQVEFLPLASFGKNIKECLFDEKPGCQTSVRKGRSSPVRETCPKPFIITPPYLNHNCASSQGSHPSRNSFFPVTQGTRSWMECFFLCVIKWTIPCYMKFPFLAHSCFAMLQQHNSNPCS